MTNETLPISQACDDKLTCYAHCIANIADLLYNTGVADDKLANDDDGEKTLLKFFRKRGHNIHKFVDVLGNISCPPLDAFDEFNVYEFKHRSSRFNDYDRIFGGAFVDEFKYDHLKLACGRLLNRRPNINTHFIQGYYIYLDAEFYVYSLNIDQITQLVAEGKTIRKDNWSSKHRNGWIIPTTHWIKLGHVFNNSNAQEQL